jgi:hypothetical protein
LWWRRGKPNDPTSGHPADKFTVVGLATEVTADDKSYLAAHPHQSERLRAYVPGEAEPEPPGVTNVYIYEYRLFDGTRRGVWNRMSLRRSDRPRRDSGR